MGRWPKFGLDPIIISVLNQFVLVVNWLLNFFFAVTGCCACRWVGPSTQSPVRQVADRLVLHWGRTLLAAPVCANDKVMSTLHHNLVSRLSELTRSSLIKTYPYPGFDKNGGGGDKESIQKRSGPATARDTVRSVSNGNTYGYGRGHSVWEYLKTRYSEISRWLLPISEWSEYRSELGIKIPD